SKVVPPPGVEPELWRRLDSDAEGELLAGPERRLQLEVLKGSSPRNPCLGRPIRLPAIDARQQIFLSRRAPVLRGRFALVTPPGRHLLGVFRLDRPGLAGRRGHEHLLADDQEAVHRPLPGRGEAPRVGLEPGPNFPRINHLTLEPEMP